MGKLESFLEKHIEGFFNRKLGSSVEQSEIMKQLERELLHRRKKGRTETVVPNSFYIELTEDDYQRLCVRRFLDDLYIKLIILLKLSLHLLQLYMVYSLLYILTLKHKQMLRLLMNYIKILF